VFPLVVDLTGRRVVVVGAGAVGTLKARQLAASGATVTVIAPEVAGDLPDGTEVLARRFTGGDLAGAALVVAATGVVEVDDAVVAEARARNALVNVVDDPVRSSFYFTAVHRDGDVVVSVSTQGASPALARWVRDRAAGALPEHLSEVARRLRGEREDLHAARVTTEGRDWTTRIEELVDELAAEERA